MKPGNTIILISVISIFVVSFFLVKKYIDIKDDKFNAIICEIDSNWTDSSSLEIEKLLKSGEDLVNSSIDYKSLLKRIYKTENWKLFSSIAENAYTKYSKDDQLLSIYIQSLILMDNHQKAIDILSDNEKNNISENFKIYANISLGRTISDDNIFYQALNETSITLFNKLFNITMNNKFLIDTGLIYLEQGNYEKADDILSSIKTDNISIKKLILLTKYFNEKFNEVNNLILKYDYSFSIEELKLLSIDINIKQNHYDNALKMNLEFINLYPDYSISPYINLILLNYYIDVPNIIEIINNGRKIFKEEKKLLLVAAEYYSNNNMENTSILILENYLNNISYDMEIEIVLRQLKGTDNPEKFINNIRDYVNFNLENMDSAIYLSWKLFENGKFYDLEKFLQVNENDFCWVLFFKALVYANGDKEKLAFDLIQSAYLLDNKWEFLYNLGILSEYTNQYQKAIEYYQNAENLMIKNKDNMEIKSLIRTALASLLYKIKDYENAYRELNIALDMNPHNLKAHLLLKKLESSRN